MAGKTRLFFFFLSPPQQKLSIHAGTEVPLRKLYDQLYKPRETAGVSCACTSGNRQTVLTMEPAVAYERVLALLSCGSGAHGKPCFRQLPMDKVAFEDVQDPPEVPAPCRSKNHTQKN